MGLKPRVGFFKFQDSNLARFLEFDYKSNSHSFNRAVIASYNNVAKYGFVATSDFIRIDQSRRSLFFILNDKISVESLEQPKKPVFLCEQPVFSKKVKEVCYDLDLLFSEKGSAINRGIKFSDRVDVKISDYIKTDAILDHIYSGWKETKESDKRVFLISFNPARYYRSYMLKSCGYNIYQKLITIREQPYALINFAIDGDRAYELSFLSLFKDKSLRLINDQNDCIIINCLYDLHTNFGIKSVNLGTHAGIKGLAFFKKKLPHYEVVVYSQ